MQSMVTKIDVDFFTRCSHQPLNIFEPSPKYSWFSHVFLSMKALATKCMSLRERNAFPVNSKDITCLAILHHDKNVQDSHMPTWTYSYTCLPNRLHSNAVIGCCRQDWPSIKAKLRHFFFLFVRSNSTWVFHNAKIVTMTKSNNNNRNPSHGGRVLRDVQHSRLSYPAGLIGWLVKCMSVGTLWCSLTVH